MTGHLSILIQSLTMQTLSETSSRTRVEASTHTSAITHEILKMCPSYIWSTGFISRL